MTDFSALYILQLVKSLPFYIPEAWKRYPFRAEPPRIGHYREYSPPPGAYASGSSGPRSSPGWGHSRGKDSHMKQTETLVVLHRGVNFGFWSRLGCSGQSTNILCHSRLGFREETQNYAKRNRSQIFFLDKSIRWLCLYIIKTHCMSHFCVW